MSRWLVALVCVVLVAGACGDDDTPVSADPDRESEATDATRAADECDWPMWGVDAGRTFTAPCESGIDASTVGDLRRIWFFNTSDVVTATPVVVDGVLYIGDWSGRFYAIDAETGDERWHVDLEFHPQMYAGQINSSASYSHVAGVPALVVNAGRTTYALAADDGRELWRNARGDAGTASEITSAPVVSGDVVVIGFDAHDNPLPSGVAAMDLHSGDDLWWFDPEDGDHRGCGGVWGAPSVDADRGLVFAGSANCPSSPEGWGPYTEALFALDLTSGEPLWSFQPHPPNNDDSDFAGAPNVFTAGGRDLVGLGNKDAVYYAVDRDTGELAWSTQATEDGFVRANYSTGGFIGPAAVADGIVVGATGVGECPCVHAFDAATGDIAWQQLAAGPSYAPTTVVGDLAFIGSLDFTLRALDLRTGEVRWSDGLTGLISGGVASIGDDLWAVAGFREPGLPGPSETSGVFRYSVDPDAVPVGSTTTTTTSASGDVAVRLVDAAGRCVDAPCELSLSLKDPPPDAVDPTITLEIGTDPFELRVQSSGLGDPAGWIREGSDAATTGASFFGVMVSERDDEPNGGFLCVIDAAGECVGTSVPTPGASYNRISILALADTDVVPGPEDGFARLVDSIAFNPPLQTEVIE